MIQRIASTFVPVAVDRDKVLKGEKSGGAFLRQVMRQKSLPQGMWLVTPEGRVLGGYAGPNNAGRKKEVLAMLAQGAQKFGAVQPRRERPAELYPHRGVGVGKDGGVTLAVYIRFRSPGGLAGPPTIDSIALAAGEWAAFRPPEATAGENWKVPADVGREFCRCLTPLTDQATMPGPKDVTAVEISGRVVSATDGVARLVYEGRIAGSGTYTINRDPNTYGKSNHGEARIRGEGLYDLKGGRLLRLGLVFDGVFRDLPPYDKPRRYVAGAEWTLAAPK